MKILSYFTKTTTSLLLLSSLVLISFNSHAGKNKVSKMITNITNSNIIDNEDGTSTVSVDFLNTKNACNGYFPTSNGFSSCSISILGEVDLNTDSDNNGTSKDLVIAKFGDSLGPNFEDRNTNTIGGAKATDWEFTKTTVKDGSEKISGKWELKNATPKYPDIYFWLAKAGPGFRLFWQINNIDNINNAICNKANDDLNFSLGCMNLAQSVTTGDWTTPANKGLSHITFFGGLCTVNCDVPPTPVPEPSTLVIFALGLLGLGVRRKQSIKARK